MAQSCRICLFCSSLPGWPLLSIPGSLEKIVCMVNQKIFLFFCQVAIFVRRYPNTFSAQWSTKPAIMNKKEVFTIPNILSFYRILVFPLILWFIISGQSDLFAIFLIISLVTEVLYGLIARMFDMQTEFGARLDSVGDQDTYLLALLKFGRLPNFHRYSWKIGVYIHGLFFFVLFSFGFHVHFYCFMISWAILAALEHNAIQLRIPEMRSNAKRIYWVLKGD